MIVHSSYQPDLQYLSEVPYFPAGPVSGCGQRIDASGFFLTYLCCPCRTLTPFTTSIYRFSERQTISGRTSARYRTNDFRCGISRTLCLQPGTMCPSLLGVAGPRRVGGSARIGRSLARRRGFVLRVGLRPDGVCGLALIIVKICRVVPSQEASGSGIGFQLSGCGPGA